MDIITGMFFALVLGSKVQGNILANSFHKIEPPAGVLSGTMTTASSKLRCATMCSKDDTCASFAYNKAGRFCEMSDKVIAGPGKDTYVKRIEGSCPTEKGYKVYSYPPDLTLCLRYSQAGVNNHADAKDKCSIDGGHLVLIDNHDKRQAILDVLITEGAPATDWIFIDGRDEFNNGQFTDREGNLMWLSWMPTEPSGSYCMLTNVDVLGYMNDGTCSYARVHFLCEIDL